MIISFSVENWMSFRDRASLSMVASRERQHSERVPRVGKYHTRILPIIALYGGNASGKTNFFKALSFAKRFVVDGTKLDSLIPVDRFRLASEKTTQPARFAFELLIDETIYEFAFAVTREAVLEERLVRISSTGETVLYHRRDGEPGFDRTVEKDQFLQFAFKGTRDNQLFLTNSVSQKVENFRPVFDWFKTTLNLIAPDSRFGPFEQLINEGHPLSTAMNAVLPQLDTGIARLGAEEIPFDDIPLPSELKIKLQEEVKEGVSASLRLDPQDHRFVVARRDGELTAKRMVSYHPKQDGGEAKFYISEESDGSQRLIDLLPAFLRMRSADSKGVYVIDEIDRSLHTLMIKCLLQSYLGACSRESRTQLLFTTHNTHLMDQRLLRRDEMWVAERDVDGASSLLSFSEYEDVRYDKDIRKSYLQGRLGGVPRISLGGVLTSPRSDREGGGGGEDEDSREND